MKNQNSPQKVMSEPSKIKHISTFFYPNNDLINDLNIYCKDTETAIKVLSAVEADLLDENDLKPIQF